MVLKKDAIEQKTSFDTLLDKWGRISASEADKVLNERETAKPEADLPQELIRNLKKRITQSKNGKE